MRGSRRSSRWGGGWSSRWSATTVSVDLRAGSLAAVVSGHDGVDVDVPGQVDLAGDERRGGAVEGQTGIRGLGKGAARS